MLTPYIRAEDALHAFLKRDLSWLRALCAHRTTFLAASALTPGACCLDCRNENHGIAPINPDTLAGAVAQAQDGERWSVNFKERSALPGPHCPGLFPKKGTPAPLQ